MSSLADSIGMLTYWARETKERMPNDFYRAKEITINEIKNQAIQGSNSLSIIIHYQHLHIGTVKYSTHEEDEIVKDLLQWLIDEGFAVHKYNSWARITWLVDKTLG